MLFTKPQLLIFLILLLTKLQSTAQTPGNRYHTFEELLESLTEEMEEAEEDEGWINELQDLHDHPINLNTSEKEELLKIPLMNEAAAEAIIACRKKTGSFFSVYELASVPGIDRDLAEKISFFLTAGDAPATIKPDSVNRHKGYHQVLVRSWCTLPPSNGYRAKNDKPPPYTGNPVKIYSRYLFEIPGLLQAGLTGDKDPGEPFFRTSCKGGFDFWSAFIGYRISKRIPQLILGDFTARAGQGLVLWQGFSMGKTSEVMTASKNNTQIRPYTSSDENRFFRGVAASFKMNKNTLNLFISSRKTDGNLSGTEDSTVIFTSLQTSGYHRTLSEIQDRKSVRHTVTGVMWYHVLPHLKFGMTALYEKFEFPLNPGDQLYEKFLFKGKENCNLGIDYRWVEGKFQLFGEGAVSRSLGVAFIQGIEARLHDQLNITLLLRHFDKDYHATWANAFAGNKKANNETGFFAGMKLLPASGITLTAYVDWYISPWIKYSTVSPSRSTASVIQAKFLFSGSFNGYIRLSNRVNEVKMTSGNLYLSGTEKRKNLRIHTIWNINDHWIFRTRAENVRFRSLTSGQGIMVYGDIAWSGENFPVIASFRLSWYNAPSYKARIYVYEDDLLSAFSFPALSGNGIRSYINLHWKISRSADIWFKTGITVLPGAEKTGSGYGQIDGNSKTDLKIQFRYRF